MRGYADLADLPEDECIALIAATAAHGHLVGVMVNDDEKADRYVEKGMAYPSVRVVDRGPGLANTILLRIGPKGH
ncbi:MAG: hypothetical protein ABIS29_19410 [Vicinamibacterales bacterium]